MNNYNDKKMLDFYRKHPGYLYYKEIISNMKSKQFNINKKRAFTGKDQNKKIKLGNTYNFNNNNKLPKIGKVKKKPKTNHIKNVVYNFNYNNYNYNSNLNYNYNINNININIRDKNNPYSLSWVDRILNQNDYRLEIKQKSNGVPKLITLNKKDEIINKIYNNTKLHINNFIEKEKDKKEENEGKNKDNKDIENDNDDLDEEQQMQFYKNQKNFFKARKDIKEEPEDLEEDKDEDKNKEKDKIVNNDNKESNNNKV